MATPDTPVSVDVEKLVYGGEGLAHVNGQVLLMPYVLPGERVTVIPERVNAGLLRASSPAVVQPSPHRVVPRCEYFGVCGGCHYQHSEYEFQLRQKEAILRETLKRLGGITYDGEIKTISAHPWNYRNRIQLHFEDGKSGFHTRGSRDLCAIERCYISSPALVDAIHKLHDAARASQWPKFLRSLELFTNEQQLQLNVVDADRPVAARFFEWCSTFLDNVAYRALEYSATGYT
ncbi:MAG: class I SAM-dependent RNA methyltransferase, partial [Acidobacteriaceae bacterium]|nr:class I SAM-dependent RNA methyltransferase [Acidobacteriaceae bacterium]